MTIKIPCHCQDPAEPGVRHRVDGPCQTLDRPRQLVLTESVMTHMLADIDQIVTEWEQYSAQFTTEEWFAKLRHAVDGEDYKR
jgi:hypothetical protein